MFPRLNFIFGSIALKLQFELFPFLPTRDGVAGFRFICVFFFWLFLCWYQKRWKVINVVLRHRCSCISSMTERTIEIYIISLRVCVVCRTDLSPY